MLSPATSSISTASDISLTSSSARWGSLHVRRNRLLLSSPPCQQLPLLCVPSSLRERKRERERERERENGVAIPGERSHSRQTDGQEKGVAVLEGRSPPGQIAPRASVRVAIASLDGQGLLLLVLLTLSELLAWVVANEEGRRRKESPEGDLRQAELHPVLPLRVTIAFLDGRGPLLLNLSKLLAWVVADEGGRRRKEREGRERALEN
ncbi:hypothetical protein EUGRSUZ_A00169 [Eucalyptus grandis]|uniref:Uncharacterized protein n=2 Tax=Eucalyptus grandis TaxID=71139 RepID=A0ACC3LZZ7_EUCGR|nr:hypothetical protein EUGRSUZ_A00169 [Eucalyptus grandis]